MSELLASLWWRKDAAATLLVLGRTIVLRRWLLVSLGRAVALMLRRALMILLMLLVLLRLLVLPGRRTVPSISSLLRWWWPLVVVSLRWSLVMSWTMSLTPTALWSVH